MRIQVMAAAVLVAAGAARGAVVDRYTFDNPVAGDATRESDLGSDNTPLTLFNGAQRVADGAFPGSGFSLRVQPVASALANDDQKGGVLFATSAASTLGGTANVTGITVMGWFKPLTAATGTTSLIGLLRGDAGTTPTAHDGRALIEIESGRLLALGRRLDSVDVRAQALSTETTATLLPTNAWTHIAAVFDYDLGSIKIYRNGALVSSTASSFAPWALTAGEDRTSASASTGIKIGGQLDDDSTPFNGLIDEVRIYNEALPATGIESVLSVYSAQAVPEPASLGVLGLGAVMLAARKRRA